MTMKKTHVITFVIVIVLALFLRIYGAGGTFPSNDHMDPAVISLNILSLDWTPDTIFRLSDENPFARLVVHPVGTAHIIATFLNALLFFKIFGIQVTEFRWLIPFILLGALNIIAIFILVRRTFNTRAAMISAILLSVIPIHVALSRMMGVPTLIGLLFLTFFVYFAQDYSEKNDKKSGVLCGVFAALTIVTNSLFLGIIPLGLYILFNSEFEKKRRVRDALASAFRRASKKELILPPIIIILILLAVHLAVVLKTGISCYDILGHTFSGGKTSIGNYAISALNWLVNDAGILLSAIILLSLAVGINDLKKNKKESIFFVWGIIFLVPFFFLIPPSATQTYVYLLFGIFGMLAYSSIVLDRFFEKNFNSKLVPIAVIAIIFVLTLYTTLIGVQGVNLPSPIKIEPPGKYGIHYQDNGAKAAGFWIRENTREEDIIFSDAKRGDPIELPIAQYYFGRTTRAFIDATPPEIREALKTKIDEYSVIVTSPRDEEGTTAQLPENFKKAAVISDAGEPRLVLYQRSRNSPPDYIDIDTANDHFDEKYGNINSLQSKRFLNDERAMHGRFFDKCAKTKLHQLYQQRLGIIRPDNTT
ncbi:glycosyltransferase family 39 protein [Candidatus Woesearchaeota archaeon]|nr:glycosyltransferase family 39 protein [Candidatus Woesearchaeota archaeon]